MKEGAAAYLIFARRKKPAMNAGSFGQPFT
jgi:hypothetical protein